LIGGDVQHILAAVRNRYLFQFQLLTPGGGTRKMIGKKARTDTRKTDSALLNKLTSLAKQVSWGNYAQARRLFELTKTASYPKPISELAEAFGLMIVKVESREFRHEQLVEDLEKTCKELAAAKRTLEGFNRTLEKKVKTRTEQLDAKNDTLSRTMQELRQEIRERKTAEKTLRKLNQEVEQTNRKLQDAYLWMRQKKDRLAARQYRESIVFLTTDDGRIRGFTEKALDLTKKSRSALKACPIQEILRTTEGQTLMELSRLVRPSMPRFTTLRIQGLPADEPVYEAKLTRLDVDDQRFIYIVLYDGQADLS
jgi:DNA repair exonuclease SbcCD ATPase subunit